MDLELGAHLDDLGHAVQQHVVELGMGEEERVGWSPAPSCSELGASLGSRVLHPLGLSWSLGRIQPKKRLLRPQPSPTLHRQSTLGA